MKRTKNVKLTAQQLGKMRVSRVPRNESLADEFLARCKDVWAVIGNYNGGNLERFEAGFLCERLPEQELVVYEAIAAALVEYRKQYQGGKVGAEDRVAFAKLIAISTGGNSVGPDEQCEQLRSCYKGPVVPFRYEQR